MKFYSCTGCNGNNRAEYSHDLLHVPLCGDCFHRYQHADFQYVSQYCLWCGHGDDGRELFLCDTCSYSYCVQCIDRTLGQKESIRVRNTDPWSCYLCTPTTTFNALKVKNDYSFYNIELAYDTILPPKGINKDRYLSDSFKVFSPGELRLLSFFESSIFSDQHQFSLILEYLSAKDIFSVLYRISKNIRGYFKQYFLYPPPGLFQTEYGIENECKLYAHQLVSLQKMYAMENHDDRFNILRGGILADQPGLGKTVTVLSLCLCSMGTMPKTPENLWDMAEINGIWKEHNKIDLIYKLMLPVFNKLKKLSTEKFIALDEVLRNIRQYESIKQFEIAVKQSIMINEGITRWDKDFMIQLFRQEMIQIKNGLDKKGRKYQSTYTGKRNAYELSLFPSSATLIIVPLVLLEHWFEQISRHIGLRYIQDYPDQSQRGICYIDGYGDLVDLQVPLSKLSVSNDCELSITQLARYSFVITTFERCHALQQTRMKLFGNIGDDVPIAAYAKAKSLQSFLGIRWLRLVVDEGHELTNVEQKTRRPKTNATVTADEFAVDENIETQGEAGQEQTVQEQTVQAPPSPIPSPTDNKKKNRRSISASPAVTVEVSPATTFINSIAAERRWVMSGTPTTGTSTTEALQQLYKLLVFLRHPIHGSNMIDGYDSWNKAIVSPIIKRNPNAWEELINLLRSVVVRHRKSDIAKFLYPPVHSLIVLDKVHDPSNPNEDSVRHVDRAKAQYIADIIAIAQQEWQRNSFKANRPKAIVFSQHRSDLQGVGHFLYLDPRFGDRSICEHEGEYRSSELSRFRHSKRKYQKCPLCSHENLITSKGNCDNTLYLVEYVDNPLPDQREHEMIIVEPSPGGHCANGRGGHYAGRCLCSVNGCTARCKGFVNPLNHQNLSMENNNPDLALISAAHIAHHVPGQRYQIGQEVIVTHVPWSEDDQVGSVLWKKGILGGRAIIRRWNKCGGRNMMFSWFGGGILDKVPWTTETEDASILLLPPDGSHGLDLSFATHLFLLEKIEDPALERQIISRAHRIGSKGPLQVHLLQTNSNN